LHWNEKSESAVEKAEKVDEKAIGRQDSQTE